MRIWLRRFAPALLALILLLGGAFAAAKVDLNRECALSLNYALEGKRLQGVQMRLYRVASIDANGKYTLTGDFAKAPLKTLNDLKDEQLRRAALTLTAYADGRGIAAMKSGKSDPLGRAAFEGLKTGMYLLVADNLVQGEKVYRFEPMLVCLPAGAGGEWSYSVNMNPKAEVLDRGTIELRVVKVWKDGKSGDRPDSIQVKLLGDGKLQETVELGVANNWRYSWPALDNSVRWILAETEVAGYTVSLKQDGQLITITNTILDPEEDTPVGGGSVLPQTGLTWWPVPLLAGAGMLIFLLGWLRRRRNEHEEES